jgi:two-component system, sensor histidine kinase
VSALILNLDDNAANRYVKSRVLRAAGFTVMEAATGADAMRLTEQHGFDLLLLDVRLPDISGIDLCRRMRADARTQRIPIIQISATHLTAQDEALALSAGADIYLFEPVGPQELASAVRTLLKLHAVEREREGLLAKAQEGQRLAEQAVRMQDEFLAMLSHELRTPMSAMLGWLHLMKTGRLSPEQHIAAIDTIERNARVQTELVNDLLDVSRIVTGKMELETEPLRLDRALENAVGTARLAAGARDIELVPHLPRRTCVVLGNAERVQQIFGNLLSNAIKFSRKGGRVEVRLECDAATARVSIADEGEGIAPEVLPHIFDRFRQADSSTRRRHGGLGLGLAIVRSLVELHGGTVAAASPGAGRGATFTVTLPLAPADATVAAPAGARQAEADLSGIRVMVVDDDDSNLQMVAQMVRLYGGSAMTAPDAAGALNLARAWEPDVLILDIGMPGKDGYELLPELRTVLGEAGLPAIALTGFAGREDAARALRAGFQAHVAKPFDVIGLCQLVSQLAGARRVQRA